ncbi:hypothetical protein IWX90DRAFT_288935 [Phyllosticta citrichinensis]|uniref:Uncharacterized protein n=1 Tax=Phyllosticta citrichinensis TaxID=1130410 RepID=A0ABR1XPD6_9PEZI
MQDCALLPPGPSLFLILILIHILPHLIHKTRRNRRIDEPRAPTSSARRALRLRRTGAARLLADIGERHLLLIGIAAQRTTRRRRRILAHLARIQPLEDDKPHRQRAKRERKVARQKRADGQRRRQRQRLHHAQADGVEIHEARDQVHLPEHQRQHRDDGARPLDRLAARVAHHQQVHGEVDHDEDEGQPPEHFVRRAEVPAAAGGRGARSDAYNDKHGDQDLRAPDDWVGEFELVWAPDEDDDVACGFGYHGAW